MNRLEPSPAESSDALRFLIKMRGLKQEDLAAIIQRGHLSAILAGKRKNRTMLARKLAKLFASPAVFIPS